ncbi:MAG: MoaD/ThiS family protein [Spirochaetia bacterium]
MGKQVTVLYFAQFQEKRGVSREAVTTESSTAIELYRELCEQYDLMYDPETVRVAVNEELQSWDAPIRDRDTVVFLTPFAGG